MIKQLIYKTRYSFRLHKVGKVSLIDAFLYPSPGINGFDGNPIEDADSEMSYWNETC